MTLQEILRNLDQLEQGLTIYAVHPWQPSSNAILARPREDGRVPDAAVAAGCRYFLEAFVARGLVHQLRLSRDHEPGEVEVCARVIEYAEFLNSRDKPYPLPKWEFPVKMMIYCSGCRKLFDIVIAGKGARNYPCPACGKVQAFDLEAFVNQAIEQTRKMRRTPRGGR